MELEASERELLDKLRASKLRIPPRPQILHDIQATLGDENSNERMIGQLIARDAALTAELFKLANSPFYRRGKKIDNVEHALKLLGRRTMGELTRSSLLRRQLGGSAARMESFWERCTDIGTICSVLCERLEQPGNLTADQAYLIGLFHDCGVPVLMQHIEGYAEAQFDCPTGPDFLAEDDPRGTSHCVAGLMVALEWELPDVLCEAIRSHHYVIAPEQPAPQSVALLQLAMYAYTRVRGWRDDEWGYHAERALQALELRPDDVESVIGEALASFELLH